MNKRSKHMKRKKSFLKIFLEKEWATVALFIIFFVIFIAPAMIKLVCPKYDYSELMVYGMKLVAVFGGGGFILLLIGVPIYRYMVKLKYLNNLTYLPVEPDELKVLNINSAADYVVYVWKQTVNEKWNICVLDTRVEQQCLDIINQVFPNEYYPHIKAILGFVREHYEEYYFANHNLFQFDVFQFEIKEYLKFKDKPWSKQECVKYILDNYKGIQYTDAFNENMNNILFGLNCPEGYWDDIKMQIGKKFN